MTPQTALAAACRQADIDRWGGIHGDDAEFARWAAAILAALDRDGWVLVNAETLAAALPDAHDIGHNGADWAAAEALARSQR